MTLKLADKVEKYWDFGPYQFHFRHLAIRSDVRDARFVGFAVFKLHKQPVGVDMHVEANMLISFEAFMSS